MRGELKLKRIYKKPETDITMFESEDILVVSAAEEVDDFMDSSNMSDWNG